MSTNQILLLSALGGLVAIAGLCGAIAALRGWVPAVVRTRTARKGQRAVEDLPPAWQANYRLLLGVATLAGIGVWVLTGWPMQGIVTAAALAGLPFVLHPGGSARRRIARLDALVQWLHQLSGLHGVGMSLDQTIAASLPRAPEELRPHIEALVTRLRQGMPARRAYRHLAADLDDAVGDQVVLLLMEHSDSGGQGLSRTLKDFAEKVARQAEDFRAVDTDRAKVRTSARQVSLFALLVAVVLLLNTSYSAPYSTPLGQLVLCAMAAMMAAALVWLRRKAEPQPEPRLLPGPAEEAQIAMPLPAQEGAR